MRVPDRGIKEKCEGSYIKPAPRRRLLQYRWQRGGKGVRSFWIVTRYGHKDTHVVATYVSRARARRHARVRAQLPKCICRVTALPRTDVCAKRPAKPCGGPFTFANCDYAAGRRQLTGSVRQDRRARVVRAFPFAEYKAGLFPLSFFFFFFSRCRAHTAPAHFVVYRQVTVLRVIKLRRNYSAGVPHGNSLWKTFRSIHLDRELFYGRANPSSVLSVIRDWKRETPDPFSTDEQDVGLFTRNRVDT